MTIHFDKHYWPECGTVVRAMPSDLNDLWEDYAPQAATFVAEALIDDPPFTKIDLVGGEPAIELFLWSVGNDCVTFREPMPDLILAAATDYDVIRSEEQAGDLEERLAALDKLSAAIDAAKELANEQLRQFRQKSVER